MKVAEITSVAIIATNARARMQYWRWLSLVVTVKSDPARIRNFATERGWHQLRLLSSRNNTYNRDYNAETPAVTGQRQVVQDPGSPCWP